MIKFFPAPLGMPLLAMLSLLAGCSDGGLQEVRQWMEDVRAQTPVKVEKLPEPKTFTPFVYSAKEEMDPFSPDKLAIALARAREHSTGHIKPDLDRRREPLESYPLDSIQMVGTLEKPGLSYALLQVDKSVFQVKTGNYVGQNYGRITRITDSAVELTEIVRDASGEWVERKARLELQENTQ